MQVRLLGDVCEVNPRTDPDLKSTQTCSFIPMSYVDDRFGIITRQDTKTVGEVMSGYTFFKEKDVLFAKITPCMENGKAAVARGLTNGIGFGSTEFHVVRPSKAVIPELVFYFLRQENVRKYAKRRMTGSAGQQRVPSTVLEEFELSLPSTIEEQKRIAAILDKADCLRRRRRYAQQLSDTFLQSAFVEMFGDPAKNPKEWKLVKLETLGELDRVGLNTDRAMHHIYSAAFILLYKLAMLLIQRDTLEVTSKHTQRRDLNKVNFGVRGLFV